MVRSTYLLTAEEKSKAANALRTLLDTANDGSVPDRLREILEESFPGCESTYVSLKLGLWEGDHELDDDRIPEFVVDILGVELLEGAHGRKLRSMILDKIFEKNPYNLRNLQLKKTDLEDWNEEEAKKILAELKEKNWFPSGGWARQFVNTLGFPLKLAGIASPRMLEAKEGVERRIDLKPLRDFQENLANQLQSTMSSRNGFDNRAILQLPTGSGKTRTAAEALICFWKKRSYDVRWILWIAQTEELCEQAFECFRQLWEEKGEEGAILNLYRVWSGRSLPDTTEDGIIIAGIDQLTTFIPDEDDLTREDELSRLQDGLGTVIIDEAHHAFARSYDRVLKSLGLTKYPDSVEQAPLIGLTATPYRTSEDETGSLLKKFGDKILCPNPTFEPSNGFDDRWRDWDFVIETMTRQKILAKPIYHYIKTSSVFNMDQRETEFLRDKKLIKNSVLERVGNDKKRNLEVYQTIKEWVDKGRTVLFFGTNVNQAILMSKFLNENGIKSAVITSDTRYGTRQNYVKMFKDGELRVLCNYQVLTTGFDAPKTDTIIIARPTGSRNLYEQMIGRGLRGPAFGGTEHCDIVTVLDNILNHDKKRIRLGHEQYAETVKVGISPEEREKIKEVQESYEAEEFDRLPEPKIPSAGETFTEEELYERFHVQTSGGIRFTKKHNTVLLIDADSSHYGDHVDEKSGIVTYIGTGEGDQTFDRGVGIYNTRIRDSANSTLLFFHKPERNKIVFRFPVQYMSHEFATEPDARGNTRHVIRFRLKIMRAKCPVCKKVASTDQEVEDFFGFREMNGVERVQSWCKECR